MIVDSTDLVSYKTKPLVRYNGKYHNYCLKLSLAVGGNLKPLYFSLDKGSRSDSTVLDKVLMGIDKLPYILYLDKGYERYERRRVLKSKNCQVKMESKNYVKNRKRGPRFLFNQNDKLKRYSIEKVFAWIKAFKCFTLLKLRRLILIKSHILFALSYISFMRENNL